MTHSGPKRRRVLALLAGGLIAALVMSALMVYAVARLRGPSAEQRAALAALQPDPPPAGRNAFGLLWLMPYDVPPAEVDALAPQDAQRFAQWPRQNDANPFNDPDAGPEIPPYIDQPPPFQSVAIDRYGPAPKPDAAMPPCGFKAGCLQAVMAQPEPVAAWARNHAALVARLDALHGTTHMRNLFGSRSDVPMPPFQWLTKLPGVRASTFAQGRHGDALNAVCRDVAMWRRLSATTDSLVFSMIAARGIGSETGLLLDMLNQLPAGTAMPQACAEAFAPGLPEEFGLCSAMRGESTYAVAMQREYATARLPLGAALSRTLFYDRDQTVAMLALDHAWACRAEAATWVRDDSPAAPVQPKPDTFACIGNAVGCALIGISLPNFADYAHRRQDAGAWVRAGRIALRMRAMAGSGGSASTLLAQALQEPGMAGRPIRWDDTSQSLVWPLYDTREGTEARLPLTLRIEAPQPSAAR